VSAPIAYRICPAKPAAHVFEVTLTVEEPAADGQEFTMPAWIPGSYMIRDYARNVVSIRAESDGLAVPLTKLDKNRWRAQPVGRPLTVVMEVFAFDESVRGAHLDASHGFFNGTCVFLEVVGKDDVPCTVDIERPPKPYGKHWRVATSMERDSASMYGFGTYRASGYAELIDHPVEMGEFTIGEFDVNGIPHTIAIRGRHAADMPRFCHDIEKICATHMSLLPPPVDLDRYLFLLHTPGEGYGGLEHAWSAAMVISRNNLPVRGQEAVTEDYRDLLGLISHEYFHLWNIKRMKPAVFRPYDLASESHTGLLWVFEGITSYYDDLALLRAGLIDVDSYLELIGRVMTRIRRGRGRLRQSVEESSFDAWTKFYKQDANSGNAIVSYYAKGALIALSLDLKLRDETDGKVSLDDVMRECWRRFGETGRGMAEREFETVASEVTGIELTDFFDAAVRGTGELPLDALLERHAIHVRYRASSGTRDKGGKPAGNTVDLWFGASVTTRGEKTIVTAVANDSPAEEAGVSPGDELVALDGLRIGPGGFDTMIRRYRVRDAVELTVFRGDELLMLPLVFGPAPESTVYLELAADAADEAVARRQRFLGK
jgi:predicted metalloprotease with PDZ domain